MKDPRSFIVLEQGEIYGREEVVQLPEKKGSYELKAELVPPSLPEKQLETLSEKRIRVLECRVQAPLIRIEVR
jgi:hypothetical protein